MLKPDIERQKLSVPALYAIARMGIGNKKIVRSTVEYDFVPHFQLLKISKEEMLLDSRLGCRLSPDVPLRNYHMHITFRAYIDPVEDDIGRHKFLSQNQPVQIFGG